MAHKRRKLMPEIHKSVLVKSLLIGKSGTEEKIRVIHLIDGTKISIKQDECNGAWMEIGKVDPYDYADSC